MDRMKMCSIDNYNRLEIINKQGDAGRLRRKGEQGGGGRLSKQGEGVDGDAGGSAAL